MGGMGMLCPAAGWCYGVTPACTHALYSCNMAVLSDMGRAVCRCRVVLVSDVSMLHSTRWWWLLWCWQVMWACCAHLRFCCWLTWTCCVQLQVALMHEKGMLCAAVE